MTPENRLATSRDSGGRFAKGVTGNPGGRPKGLASQIRERSEEGAKLVEVVWDIMENPGGTGVQAKKLQLQAVEWLTDRGWGKAIAIVEHSGSVTNINVLANMSDEDLRAVIRAGSIVEEAQAKAIEGEARAIQ